MRFDASAVPRPRVILSRAVVRNRDARRLRNELRRLLWPGDHAVPVDRPELAWLLRRALAGYVPWIRVWPAGEWTWT